MTDTRKALEAAAKAVREFCVGPYYPDAEISAHSLFGAYSAARAAITAYLEAMDVEPIARAASDCDAGEPGDFDALHAGDKARYRDYARAILAALKPGKATPHD